MLTMSPTNRSPKSITGRNKLNFIFDLKTLLEILNVGGYIRNNGTVFNSHHSQYSNETTYSTQFRLLIEYGYKYDQENDIICNPAMYSYVHNNLTLCRPNLLNNRLHKQPNKMTVTKKNIEAQTAVTRKVLAEGGYIMGNGVLYRREHSKIPGVIDFQPYYKICKEDEDIVELDYETGIVYLKSHHKRILRERTVLDLVTDMKNTDGV